jgi:alpha-1,2-mannosyltransferase
MVSAVGAFLLVFTPIRLLPEHHEIDATLWRQVIGSSYVWWALAVITAAGTITGRGTPSTDATEHIAPVSATN